MKIAIPIWEGRVSPVMDTANELLVIEVNDGAEVSRQVERTPRPYGTHLAKFVSDLGVEVVLCGAISRQLESLLERSGIEIIGCIKGNVDEVIMAYLNDTLDSRHFFIPANRVGHGHRRKGRYRGPIRGYGRGKRFKEDS